MVYEGTKGDVEGVAYVKHENVYGQDLVHAMEAVYELSFGGVIPFMMVEHDYGCGISGAESGISAVGEDAYSAVWVGFELFKEVASRGVLFGRFLGITEEVNAVDFRTVLHVERMAVEVRF